MLQTADKPQTRRKHLPSPLRGRGTAASAVVDEVAKNSINTWFFDSTIVSTSSVSLGADSFPSKGKPRKADFVRSLTAPSGAEKRIVSITAL